MDEFPINNDFDEQRPVRKVSNIGQGTNQKQSYKRDEANGQKKVIAVGGKQQNAVAQNNHASDDISNRLKKRQAPDGGESASLMSLESLIRLQKTGSSSHVTNS